jgi:hypothetical protein
MRHRGVFALAALLILPASVAVAQEKNADRWQITLASGDYVWDIRLVKLDGDQLVFLQADTTGSVGVDKIDELRLIQKTEVRLAEGAGAAQRALTGADDEVYDMKTLDFAGRVRAIQQIFLLHPPQTP